MPQDRTKLHQAVLMSVACNSIMLEVCDELARTDLYKQDRKQRINALTKDLEAFLAKFYKDIGAEEEEQYYKLVRCVERAAKMLAGLTPSRIDQFAALLMAFESGEVYEASSDKAMTGMINQKRVKPITV